VFAATGRPLVAWQLRRRAGAEGSESRRFVLDPPRARIAAHIAARFEAMLAAGEGWKRRGCWPDSTRPACRPAAGLKALQPWRRAGLGREEAG